MTKPVLEIKNLSKHYGSLKAVDGLNLSVEKGSVFGFLGLNGAGKTTTLRMITGLARPTGGTIEINGDRVGFGVPETCRHIGYLPDVPEFYGFMKPAEYLRLCGRLYGMDGEAIEKKSRELLQTVGLEGVGRSISGFSRGMKQRLGIAQALIHDPELLILDEPTSALDPVGRKEILEIIHALRGRLTVLFSTHILSDVERVADTIGILHGGKLALTGNLAEIEKQYAGRTICLETTLPEKIPELVSALRGLPFVKDIKQAGAGKLYVTCTDSGAFYKAVCPLLAGIGIPLSHLERMESNLEDVFIEVIKGA